MAFIVDSNLVAKRRIMSKVAVYFVVFPLALDHGAVAVLLEAAASLHQPLISVLLDVAPIGAFFALQLGYLVVLEQESVQVHLQFESLAFVLDQMCAHFFEFLQACVPARSAILGRFVEN